MWPNDNFVHIQVEAVDRKNHEVCLYSAGRLSDVTGGTNPMSKPQAYLDVYVTWYGRTTILEADTLRLTMNTFSRQIETRGQDKPTQQPTLASISERWASRRPSRLLSILCS